MAKIIRLSLVLLLITAITGIILGAVYTVTLEPIRKVKEREKMEALAATLPGAKEFKTLPVKGDAGIILEINEGSAAGAVVGYNFTVTPKGYAGPIEMVVGEAKDGRLMDIKILKHAETPGLGAKATEPLFSGQFKNKSVPKIEVSKTPPASTSEIQAISGATITSRAVAAGVNTALDYWKGNFSGGAAQTASAVSEPSAPADNSAAADAVSSASKKDDKDEEDKD